MRVPRKPKEPIRLRTRLLKDGNRTLYLDIYENGVRKYEYLKMYLVPETTPAAKARNASTMRAATAIKAQRIIEFTNGKAGISNNLEVASKITLDELLEAYKAKKMRRGQTIEILPSLKQHLQNAGISFKTRLGSIDTGLCMKFIDYLKQSELKASSSVQYMNSFNAVLNDAVRNGLLWENPFKKIDKADKIKSKQAERDFLTAEEVKALIVTPPLRKPHFKQVFLFSCFCGLRFSDIKALKWENLVTDDAGNTFARIVQQKTKEPLILPLCEDALRWLPERKPNGKDAEPIFPNLNKGNLDRNLLIWTKKAGITKRVSIHTARHTFATMLISYGIDLYSVSKLLGHKKLSTTQIYATLVDSKKVEAVSVFDGKF